MKLPEIIKRSTLMICLAVALLLIISVGDFYDEIGSYLIKIVNEVYYGLDV